MNPIKWAKGVQPLLVPISEVSQHPDNPNRGDDPNLIESIEVNGFVTAVTADAKTGHIIAGNTRYRALLALGAAEIPVLWVDHWDGQDSIRYLIGDNASGRRAVMDTAAELELLKDLIESPIGLVGSSITDAQYEAMLLEGALEAPPEGTGFGQGTAPLGIYQVILEFKDAEDERDIAFAELAERYDHVRTANL